MQEAQVVVGAGFGDEGKGILTDALAARCMQTQGRCTVVRYNGGAQAGHTVWANGKRHVFHHFSSGAMAGADSYLGPEFVVHPMLFLTEWHTLSSMGANTHISMHPHCKISTPYDVMINQAIETARGNERHGSCGVGFGETIERCQDPQARILACDGSELSATLDYIRRSYLPRRLKALGLAPDALSAWVNDEAIATKFVWDMRRFAHMVKTRTPGQAFSDGAIIFEGAQGLALDEDLGHFPFVTRSKTGLPYVADICAETGITKLQVHYAMRAYTTRHGAGPMTQEGACPAARFEDATNQPNAFQGTLRFGPLDMEGIGKRIEQDLRRVSNACMDIKHGVFVSCMDQMGPQVPLADGSRIDTKKLPGYAARCVGGLWHLESHGPTRGDVCFEQYQLAAA